MSSNTLFMQQPLGVPGGTFRLRIANLLGLLGITSLALGFALRTGPVNLGLGLMLIALALQWPEAWPRLRREPFFWAMLVLVAYLILHGMWSAWVYPADEVKVGKGLKQLVGISGLLTVVVAWSLQGDPRRIALALILSGLSLLIAIGQHTSFADLQAQIAGRRESYGLGNNGPGIYMSAGLLALAALGVKCITRLPAERGWLRIMSWILLFGVAAVFAAAVVFNQSRSSWLAAALVLPVCIAIAGYLHYKAGRIRVTPRFALIFALVLLGLLAAGGYAASGVVAKRLSQEQETIAAIKAGDLSNVPMTSIGSRVHMWKAAVGYINERPVLGWGPGSAPMLLSKAPEQFPYPHFHNLYLNLLVEVGVVGLVLFIVMGGVLARTVMLAWRQGIMSPELTLFVGGTAALYLIASFAQIRHDDAHGMAFVALLTGVALTRWLHRQV